MLEKGCKRSIMSWSLKRALISHLTQDLDCVLPRCRLNEVSHSLSKRVLRLLKVLPIYPLRGRVNRVKILYHSSGRALRWSRSSRRSIKRESLVAGSQNGSTFVSCHNEMSFIITRLIGICSRLLLKRRRSLAKFAGLTYFLLAPSSTILERASSVKIIQNMGQSSLCR